MKINFFNIRKDKVAKQSKIEALVNEFTGTFNLLEKTDLNVLTDNKIGAFYIECNIKAKDVVEKGSIDVPLDPDNQSEYRANRQVVENNPAYHKMIEDAKDGRVFCNIIAEYNTKFEFERPLKIIGGQHRYLAIESALDDNINEYHGIKVYFGLDTNQRLDVQLISNTNIAVSNDLLDRMFETVKGPELRNWCQEVGILEAGEDFADKKQRGSQISVRGARSLILNYLEGKKIPDKKFNNLKTNPILPATGSVDKNWEIVRNNQEIWKDEILKKVGKAFGNLIKAQRDYFKSKKSKNFEFADKALSYSTLSAWAYVAGVLHKNDVRLKRHFDLSKITNTDPLNSAILAKGRHKTDPENYRGLGTRTDPKDRGRLAELFFTQTDKGDGINKKLVDLAVQKYYLKDAMLTVKEMEKNL
jgi:hypothetical protein